jgi:hypothetical protein
MDETRQLQIDTVAPRKIYFAGLAFFITCSVALGLWAFTLLILSR